MVILLGQQVGLEHPANRPFSAIVRFQADAASHLKANQPTLRLHAEQGVGQAAQMRQMPGQHHVLGFLAKATRQRRHGIVRRQPLDLPDAERGPEMEGEDLRRLAGAQLVAVLDDVNGEGELADVLRQSLDRKSVV